MLSRQLKEQEYRGELQTSGTWGRNAAEWQRKPLGGLLHLPRELMVAQSHGDDLHTFSGLRMGLINQIVRSWEVFKILEIL